MPLVLEVLALPGQWDEGTRVEIWFGRGDPLRTGSPFGILAPALRRTAGIHEGEPVEVRRADGGVAVAAQVETEIVGDDEDHVARGGLGVQPGGHGPAQQRGQEDQEGAHGWSLRKRRRRRCR